MRITAHVFSIFGCPFSAASKNLLVNYGVDYTESFPTSTERAALKKQYNYNHLPIIVVKFGTKKRAILGADKLAEYLAPLAR